MPGARIENGKRVALRTVEKEDVSFLQRAYTNPELRYSLGTTPMSQSQIEEHTDEKDGNQFLVCLDEETLEPANLMRVV